MGVLLGEGLSVPVATMVVTALAAGIAALRWTRKALLVMAVRASAELLGVASPDAARTGNVRTRDPRHCRHHHADESHSSPV